MQEASIEKMIQAIKVAIDNTLFYPRTFTLGAKELKHSLANQKNTIKKIIADEYDKLSRLVDRSVIQDSCSVRNRLRTIRLANQLITDKGELNSHLLSSTIDCLTKYLYSLGPNRQYDSKRQEHILKVLTLLNQSKELTRALKKIGKPYSHKYAEQIIRDTLKLPANTVLNDAHARRAVLCAWMCYLRQNVGSCFATAPAEIIHDEQPELFLNDMDELLSTGRLKRTFEGVEYAVPLSFSWGAGDLKKPILIQSEDIEKNPELWLSPGLIAAFEATELLDKIGSVKLKIKKIHELMITFLKSLGQNRPYFYINSEMIIRTILLNHLKITEENLKDFDNRPKGMIQGNLLMSIPQSSMGSGGLGEACSKFYIQLDQASNAFKSLADNALLKSWEFTLASFSEIKAQFTRWNLYSSLGFGMDEPGGIGQCLYEIIKRKLDQTNERVQEFQADYELAYSHIKFLEGRIKSASTDKEAQWIRAEYQAKSNEFYTLQELRDKLHYKAQTYANLLEFLVDGYYELFPDYFQEVYDADMQEVTAGPYDDSPAGFRLLYKHGRSNTSQWTRIHHPQEFIDSLVSFFIGTESQIIAKLELKEMESDISEIVTAVVNHIKTNEFLESAFYRIAAIHKTAIVRNPLENLDKIEKKPWAYTSGGTMNTLVSCYYKRTTSPTEVKRWVENDTELLVFLIDIMKQMPPKMSDDFIKNPTKSLLMHSPTHAFLLKPGLNPFKDLWTNEAYTYTWLRDKFIIPAQRFIEGMFLSEDMISFLIQTFQNNLPKEFQHYFGKNLGHTYSQLTPIEFRDYLITGMEKDRALRRLTTSFLTADDIDSSLYSLLPLLPKHQLKEALETIFNLIKGISITEKEILFSHFDEMISSQNYYSYIPANQLKDICKALLCLINFENSKRLDYHQQIANITQELRFSMPAPIIVADTNWVKDEFGFLVNPGTGRFEFWRVDYTGSVGVPMTSWRLWLDGSRQDLYWGVYTNPTEYS